ncbi:hypothetical protein M3Y96_00638400 [Aphelenchoides besseyi]|nr:hypothetical protein M3Y96_00638400 [Aphelenchoides besseyi]
MCLLVVRLLLLLIETYKSDDIKVVFNTHLLFVLHEQVVFSTIMKFLNFFFVFALIFVSVSSRSLREDRSIELGGGSHEGGYRAGYGAVPMAGVGGYGGVPVASPVVYPAVGR